MYHHEYYVMSTQLGIARLHEVAMKGCCRRLNISSLTYFAANLSFLQQKNIKTKRSPVGSSVILMEGIISEHYLREDYFQ